MDKRRHRSILIMFLLISALLAFVYYLFVPFDQFLPAELLQATPLDLPMWILGLANAGIIIVVYSGLGLAGIWLASRVMLPGVYRERAGWKGWVITPLFYGVISGVLLVAGVYLFTSIAAGMDFPHPPFPAYLLMSATAAVNEEVLYRLFLMSLWVFLLNLALRRLDVKRISLWIANLIATLVFAAAHLPGAMLLLGVNSPADIPVPIMLEILILNSVVGFIAGWQYMRNGLVGAIGVHFWADVIFHSLGTLLH
jgi:membrane protease YdiL (CAAX protease family)